MTWSHVYLFLYHSSSVVLYNFAFFIPSASEWRILKSLAFLESMNDGLFSMTGQGSLVQSLN